MKSKGKGFATHGDSENEGKYIGKGEFANMPKEVKMEMYPKSRLGSDDVPDDIKRIDRENEQMQSKRPKYRSNQH
jgi:hypothetical protein